MKALDSYLRHLPRHWWRPFFAGAATGVLAGVVLARRRREAGPRDEAPRGRAQVADGPGATERLSRVWEEAREGIVAARERVFGADGPDMAAIRARVAGFEGAGAVRIRSLGEGIVEVVGAAPDGTAVERVLGAVAEAEGVEVVVNRVWTPTSASV